tara:strand:+ start:3098 stop:4084 length:987 start_codon:yes stop_codon:yes gene_type:complete
MNRGYKSYYKDWLGVDLVNLKSDIKLDIECNGWQSLKDDLSEYNSIEVLLSGGVDSMFDCKILKRLDIPFHATTYRYDNDYNDWEVKTAEKFCRENNIKHYIQDFNMTNFLESGEFEIYADHGETSSPHYASFFKMYRQTKADMIIADGNPPVVLLDDRDLNHVEAEAKCVEIEDHKIKKKHYGVQTIGKHEYPIICFGMQANIGSQLNYIEKIKQPAILMLSYYTPKIFLDGCKKVIEYQKKFKEDNPDDLRWPYFFDDDIGKHILYNYVYDVDLPKIEPKTGFEKIKKHYKYNIGKSFDELFREPLQEKFPNTMYDTSIGGVINDL